MRIKVKVTPRAKDNLVMPVEDYFRVRVTVPADKGQANEKVIELLAEYFRIPKSRLTVVSGHTYREKIIEIKEF